jgi:L-2,4-diaminobutyrate decarboxylase
VVPAVATRAAAAGLWLHVDAAWGGGLLFSDRHRGLLEGIEAADSVAVDLHKLLWQPAGCGVFLVRDRAWLAPIEVTVPYLNPDPPASWPEEWRMPHLVGRSLATTRRFAALGAPAQLPGRRPAGHRRAGRPDPGAGRPGRRGRRGRAGPGADRPPRARLGGVPLPPVARRPGALRPGQRGRPAAPAGHRQAVVGRTEVAGRAHLKLTLMNPTATEADVAALVARAGPCPPPPCSRSAPRTIPAWSAGGSPAASTTAWPAGRARPALLPPAETRRLLAAGL